eukprot:530714-Amphidinium_carterae.1
MLLFSRVSVSDCRFALKLFNIGLDVFFGQFCADCADSLTRIERRTFTIFVARAVRDATRCVGSAAGLCHNRVVLVCSLVSSCSSLAVAPPASGLIHVPVIGVCVHFNPSKSQLALHVQGKLSSTMRCTKGWQFELRTVLYAVAVSQRQRNSEPWLIPDVSILRFT